MTPPNKITVTRKMETADKAAFKSDHLKQKSQELGERALRTETVLRPLFVITMLCILPFLPFFTDAPILRVAIGELRSHSVATSPASTNVVDTIVARLTGGEASSPTVAPAETEPSTMQVFYVILGQTAVVFLLAFFGKNDDDESDGLSDMVLRGAGLLAALAIPCIALSTILAQANVATLEGAAAPSWLQMIGQNAHFIGFCIFSLGAHCAVWAKAPEIPKALMSELPNTLKRPIYLMLARSYEGAAKRLNVRTEVIVVKVTTEDKRLAEKTNTEDKELEFIYITAHAEVATLIEKYRKAA